MGIRLVTDDTDTARIIAACLVVHALKDKECRRAMRPHSRTARDFIKWRRARQFSRDIAALKAKLNIS